ncbi:hypothetical protein [Saccharopolyspora sp. ASAGF58]|uniref:hypothetical protein n=1 Tax=Saccharopolyspora sp. ASAGF58 TaxID=2719023 RepID=UPI00144026D9|nr:hypothetical protein [Saccharopolyspora sp. ASAGF58]QIZ34619.1 hypothetical protein FDZ84_07565 [Saccharopolyspora sp. ASAGF58]
MDTMTPGNDARTNSSAAVDHVTIAPSILYFGTPVVLLSTENSDGTANLAPMSSAWAHDQLSGTRAVVRR